MDTQKLKVICQKVTESLTPAEVQITDLGKSSFTVRVVSDKFRNQSPLQRFQALSDLFDSKEPDLSEAYAFDFEAWTSDEYAQLKREGKITDAESDWDQGMAARTL